MPWPAVKRALTERSAAGRKLDQKTKPAGFKRASSTTVGYYSNKDIALGHDNGYKGAPPTCYAPQHNLPPFSRRLRHSWDDPPEVAAASP